MSEFIGSEVFLESYWYVVAYDKETEFEVGSESSSHALARELMLAMGYSEYQDCYSVTEEGLKILSNYGYEIDTKTKDYQLEICSD